MKKKILVDLSILRNIHCGLGQVAMNYGKYFKQNYSSTDDYELYLLVPKKMFGEFGSEVKYIASNWWRKHISFLFPKFDVWHAIHQLSRFRPIYGSTKYILTIHDFNFLYEKSGSRAQRYLKSIQRKIDRADKIVCISQFAKSETERFANLGNKKVHVIYNGVEQLDAGAANRPDFIRNDKSFFFSIGQIKEKKNFHVLLPLMKLFPEKELYIAGQMGTPYAELIKSQIELMAITNVHLVGPVADEERVWLYRHCEAFLFPSLLEGFGLPVIEAMSFGKPVFTSQETSLKEIGGGFTYFWNNFDAASMKNVIDDNLHTFNSAPIWARRNIDYAKSFSYKKHMEQYVAIYLQLLK